MPGRKNSVNTNHGHRQRFQMVESYRTGSGPLHLLFVFSVLSVFLIHNVDRFGVLFLSKMGFESLRF